MLGQSDGAWRCSGEGRYRCPGPSQQVSSHPWSPGIGKHSKKLISVNSIQFPNNHQHSPLRHYLSFLESPLLSFFRRLVTVFVLFSLVLEVCYPRGWTRQQTKWERSERSKKESEWYISRKSQQSTACLPENYWRTQKGINRSRKTA